MNNPFETIKNWLDKNQMTADEKRRMRSTLVSYAMNHPVKSGLLSPYTFRYATLALASLVLVLGGSIGITSASSQALPNSPLYSIKIWLEEYQVKNQKTPEAVIAFETKRIETRFKEATRLAVNQELDDTSSALIQGGIEHSRVAIKNVAETIQDKNPELALSAASVLETTFSSNGKILATIEQNTNQNIGPIVLAAQVTTKTLATEKIKFEQIVALKANDTTKLAAEKRFDEVTKLLAVLPEMEVKTQIDAKTNDVMTTEAVDTTAEPSSADVVTMSLMVEDISLARKATVPEPEKTAREKAEEFAAEAQVKMDAGLYSEALILLEKAGQILDEITLTNSLEETYKVNVDKVKTSEAVEIKATTEIKDTTQDILESQVKKEPTQ